MSNLSNLTNKILKEAEDKKNEIVSEAKEKETKLVEGKISEAKKEEKLLSDRSNREATTKRERILSNAELKVRNEKLEAKQVIMEKVFKKAVENLSALSGEKLLNYIKESVLSLDITGKERVILNKQGKMMISKEFIDSLNKELIAKGKDGNLTISDEVRNFQGGFILEKDGIEINNTFEALVNSMKDQLEYEVAKVLFN